MILKQIVYFGNKIVCICDGKCNKAWGRNGRPVKELSDDDYLSDDDLPDAPVNPGSYEGGEGKPTDKNINKWCVRECERSIIVEDDTEFELPDFSNPDKKANSEEIKKEVDEMNALPVKENQPGQKFPRGSRVKVADEMPSSMRHFESGFEAIVEYTYAQKYHGDDNKEYSLIQLDEKGKPVNAIAWYYEYQLTLISDDTEAGLKIIEEYERNK